MKIDFELEQQDLYVRQGQFFRNHTRLHNLPRRIYDSLFCLSTFTHDYYLWAQTSWVILSHSDPDVDKNTNCENVIKLPSIRLQLIRICILFYLQIYKENDFLQCREISLRSDHILSDLWLKVINMTKWINFDL